MSLRSTLSLAGAALLLAGCYHATIETGLAPSPQTVEQPWASAWLDGLVSPKLVETAAKCPNGVSKVETQLSFVNLLVGFITLGIYTPMTIKATCAAGGHAALPPGASQIRLGDNPTSQDVRNALRQAAVESVTSGAPVYLVR
jgi:Bor protein